MSLSHTDGWAWTLTTTNIKPFKPLKIAFYITGAYISKCAAHDLESYLYEWSIFIYCWVILQKMGWFENKPHLLISML